MSSGANLRSGSRLVVVGDRVGSGSVDEVLWLLEDKVRGNSRLSDGLLVVAGSSTGTAVLNTEDSISEATAHVWFFSGCSCRGCGEMGVNVGEVAANWNADEVRDCESWCVGVDLLKGLARSAAHAPPPCCNTSS